MEMFIPLGQSFSTLALLTFGLDDFFSCGGGGREWGQG